ncbi:MAG: type II secretion system protein [Verrucomicrobiaceae bacterium]|nr:MAG: type II secretion system protein [Verrucomicrobiaceae bacterium]
MKVVRTSRPRGFLLLEMVLALTVFGIAATAFAVALKQMGMAASLAQEELRITRILESALDETVSIPVLEEGVTNSTAGEDNIELDTTIELMEDLVNKDGQPISQIYHIKIEARWYANGQWQERMVDTWRNGNMYQP